jgi:hypothetical protein
MFKFLFIFCFFSITLWAYPTLQKMEDLLSYIKEDNDQTLVVFDIDYTLTMPGEPAFHMALFKQYQSAIKEWIKNLTEEEKFWLAPFIVTKSHSKLIEKETPFLIAFIQQKGIPALALTACPSADISIIGKLVEWRDREFKAMGIDFSKSFPHIAPFMMTNYKGNYECYPGFYEGILFCNFTPFLKTTDLATKGDVLRQFLEHAHWKPEHIIMIDDDSKNLDEIAQVMQEWGVAYTGLHYQGAENVEIPFLSKEAMQHAWGQIIQQIKDEKIHGRGKR